MPRVSDSLPEETPPFIWEESGNLHLMAEFSPPFVRMSGHCTVQLRETEGKIMASEHSFPIYYTLTGFDLVCSIRSVQIFGQHALISLAIYLDHCDSNSSCLLKSKWLFLLIPWYSFRDFNLPATLFQMCHLSIHPSIYSSC